MFTCFLLCDNALLSSIDSDNKLTVYTAIARVLIPKNTYSIEHPQTHLTSMPRNKLKNRPTSTRNTHPDRETPEKGNHLDSEINTRPPPAAKRPKTSPPPQSPVLPSLYAATHTSEHTRRKERSNHTSDTDGKHDVPTGSKRLSAANWDGMSRNQKKNWQRLHK